MKLNKLLLCGIAILGLSSCQSESKEQYRETHLLMVFNKVNPDGWDVVGGSQNIVYLDSQYLTVDGVYQKYDDYSMSRVFVNKEDKSIYKMGFYYGVIHPTEDFSYTEYQAYKVEFLGFTTFDIA